MDEGACLIELIYDDDHVSDYRFLEANAAFTRQTGLAVVDGRTVREIAPAHEAHWFTLYETIARTGESVRLDRPARCMGERWFLVHAFRVGAPEQHQLGVLFHDVTKCHRPEPVAGEVQRRQTLMLALSDRLALLHHPAAVEYEVCRTLGEHLKASRVICAHLDFQRRHFVVENDYHTDPMRSAAGLYPVTEAWLHDAFPLIAGRAIVANRGNPAPGRGSPTLLSAPEIAAHLTVPILKNGVLQAVVSVQHASAREWTPLDIALAHECADRLKLADARARAEIELRRVDQNKSEFLALLGHELRNPLAAIKGGVALLQAAQAQADSRHSVVPILAEQIRHLERLVDDALDLARIERGRLQVRREKIALQATVTQALAMVGELAHARTEEIRPAMPEEPIVIEADPVRLTQVLVNLLTNALRFSPDGSVVEISVEKQAPNAIVRVRDYGAGIAPDMLPTLFEEFTQARRALRLSEGGLGFGLSVARQLVELHGGTLEAFSEGEGKGAELVVSLPLPAEAA